MVAGRQRIGVIVDRMSLARWQLQALRSIVEDSDLLIYSCSNGRPERRRLRHALYYLLNLFTVRNRMTRQVSWPDDLPVVAVQEFDASQDGSWQALPPDLLGRLKSDRLDAVIKFGMGLLRVPPNEQLAIPILSYHHGNPAEFRGRPAGFYEMLTGAPVMGQIVQRLSNQLDSGDIAAFAETKVSGHSYRSTLVEAYRHSPLLLRTAIASCIEGRNLRPEQLGKAYRLPSNAVVLKFLLMQWRRAAAYLFYGLFKEKRWNVATVVVEAEAALDSITRAVSQQTHWQTVRIPQGYRFLADPFFHPDDGLLVEGLNRRSFRGEILHIANDIAQRVSGRGGHYSYPSTYMDGETCHIIPETSEWSPAQSFPLHGNDLGEPVELRIPGRPALLDPTVFRDQGSLYLFANLASEGPSVLRLWTSGDLFDEFSEHPQSPIRISPQGSRMAGNICSMDGKLIRIGQDLRRGYGDGLSFFHVTQLDRLSYREEHIRDFRFDHCKGPHTLNLGRGSAAFDFYIERFSPFAGLRRLKERRAARRA